MSTKNLSRYILPVVSGTMAGMILQAFGEMGLHVVYPPPPGISLDDKVALKAFMDQLPATAFVLLLVNYALCSFIAGIVATLISGRTVMAPAVIAGIIITLGGVFNAFMIPEQPLWFSAVSVLLHLPMAVLGYMIVRKRLA